MKETKVKLSKRMRKGGLRKKGEGGPRMNSFHWALMGWLENKGHLFQRRLLVFFLGADERLRQRPPPCSCYWDRAVALMIWYIFVHTLYSSIWRKDAVVMEFDALC